LTPDNRNQVVSSLLEIGDSLNLTGQNRQLSVFEFELAGTLTPDAAKVGIVRLYANDGTSGAPGTLLYESPTFALESGPKSYKISNIQGVSLPESVTWSFGSAGLGAGESAAVLLYNPPSVGTSSDAFWERTPVGWTSKVLDAGTGTIPANFGVRITAVPEPTTIQLAVLGGLAALGYGVFRRRS
jgi:hypothetical protein